MRKSPCYTATYWRVAGRWLPFWRPPRSQRPGQGPRSSHPKAGPALRSPLKVQFGAQMSRPDSVIIRMIFLCSLASNKSHMCAVTTVVNYVLFVRLIFIITIIQSTKHWMGHAVTQWLRYCATNRKVAGSIPDGVTGSFHWRNPSDRTMALGSTQPLTEW
jgi:hypothetical protein